MIRLKRHTKYDRLEKMLTDSIKEEQIKLGYQEETIRFYYPLPSLLRLLDQEKGMDQEKEAYRYCIKFEDGHTTYHRFLPEDFEEINWAE